MKGRSTRGGVLLSRTKHTSGAWDLAGPWGHGEQGNKKRWVEDRKVWGIQLKTNVALQ